MVDNSLKFEEFRNTFRSFSYDAYHLEDDGKNIIVTYDFEIEKLSKFNPKIIIEKEQIKRQLNKAGLKDDIDFEDETLKLLIFNLGMAEAVSYIKIACPKKMFVKCGYLNEKQIAWFKKLYVNGLGEFFYVNGIKHINTENFIDIVCLQEEKSISPSNKKLIGNLIPVGGGKDSNVTMEILKPLENENTAFIVNPRGATIDSVNAAGMHDSKITVQRILDERMLKLNQKGFLNGHTPFSALLAFLSTTVAYISGKKYVILSNESSANEPNVKGTKINHQYSKTVEFENDFRNYEMEYIKSNVEYFSLLRPLCETQIAAIFSKYPKYFGVFKSCNVGSKENIWCSKCSKCLFVYIILSPYLTDAELKKIFGRNMLNDIDMEETFMQLIGKSTNKPFDCVGTYEEIEYSLAVTLKKKLRTNEEIPRLLDMYYKKYFYSDIAIVNETIISGDNKLLFGYIKENNVRGVFEKLLKEKLKEI